MELKEILEELSIFGDDLPVPKEALAEAVRHKEEITPILLESLDMVYEKVLSEGEGVCDIPAYELAAYAIFLLAELREQQAFPKLLRLLTLDSDDLDLVLGDELSHMGSILYSTYNGDLSGAKEILSNHNLYPFAREEVLNFMLGLFQDGRLPREELISLLREHLASLGEGEDEAIFGGALANLIADSDFYELAEDVREAYRLKKIDRMRLGDFDRFFDYLYNETKYAEHVRLISNTAEELEKWACFESGATSEPHISEILSWDVGRNDPCPCGSGKKFKKCCLRIKEEWEFKYDSQHSFESGLDRYPPVDRRGDRPGLSEFYNRDAIEVDWLVYRALFILDYPANRQKKEVRKAHTEAQNLLCEAFEKFQQVCEAKGLHSAAEYDREHKVHYYASEWLTLLRDILAYKGDDRCYAVRAVL